MTGRIRWERNDDGSTVTPAHEGYAGTIGEPLFFIFEPDDRDPWWILTSSLPGLPGAGQAERRAHGDDTDGLKAEAERWLSEFISSLGAVFPDALRHAATEELTRRREVISEALDCEHLNRSMGWAEALGWVLALLGHATPDEPAKENDR